MTAIDIVIVAAITLFIYWAIGIIVFWATGENETFSALWAMGPLYWILYAVCTPVRMIRKHWIKKGK
jgi:hypothetical protein